MRNPNKILHWVFFIFRR